MRTNINFSLTPDIINKAAEFAKNSVNTNSNKYAYRNQFNPAKIEKDIMIGKLGEEVVHQLLLPDFSDLTAPDYQIYSSKDKSWDPDLKSANFKIAVKTQDVVSANQWGESWVFQNRVGSKYDVDKEVFGSEIKNNYVAFVLLDLQNKIGTLRGLVKVIWLHKNNLFQPMKKANLRNNKVAVYYKDLEKCDNLWQL